MIWLKYLICTGIGLSVHILAPHVLFDHGTGGMGIPTRVMYMDKKSLSIMREDGYACVLGYDGKSIEGSCGLVADPKQDAVTCEAIDD